MVIAQSIPKKTDLGIAFLNTFNIEQRRKLDARLRQLLILIDGKKTVEELLELSFSGIDVAAFETLHTQGLIAIDDAKDTKNFSTIQFDNKQPHTKNIHDSIVAQQVVKASLGSSATSTVSLSQLRFDALDILLDLSMEDFAARPWIDDFEKADSVEKIMFLIQQFKVSPVGQKHPGFVQRLQKL